MATQPAFVLPWKRYGITTFHNSLLSLFVNISVNQAVEGGSISHAKKLSTLKQSDKV
jgi:hypothetical protein